MRIAALDIGGTSIKSGVWDGTMVYQWKETPTNASEGGVRLMERAKEILREYAPFDAVGISTAGQVDTEKGAIYYANENIPEYTGMEVRRIMEECFGVPVWVENDVNAAAVGEAHFGAGREVSDFLCLTYGTGVGGTIVIDGKVYGGCSFSAGSFGGILTHPEDAVSGEDFSGCYEKYASVTALIRNARRLDESLTDGRAVFAAFDRPQVRQLVDQWINEVVYGLVTLVHVFNPQRIVLGGGIMDQPYISMEVRQRLLSLVSPGFRKTEVIRAQLGNQAGFLGAAYEASRRIKTNTL